MKSRVSVYRTLTVHVGSRRKRGVLGQGIDNIVIGTVGIVVGLLGVVVVLRDVRQLQVPLEVLPTFVRTEYSQLSVRWGTAMSKGGKVEGLSRGVVLRTASPQRSWLGLATSLVSAINACY